MEEQVRGIVADLMEDVVVAKPDDPIAFLLEMLQSNGKKAGDAALSRSTSSKLSRKKKTFVLNTLTSPVRSLLCRVSFSRTPSASHRSLLFFFTNRLSLFLSTFFTGLSCLFGYRSKRNISDRRKGTSFKYCQTFPTVQETDQGCAGQV